jgi:putative PIN family toxin of toxin-antitoxin system
LIRVLLDTNLIVSGLLTIDGPPARLLLAWGVGAFEVIMSPRLLAELEGVLARPKIRRRIGEADAASFVEWMHRTAIWVDDPIPSRGLAPDPGDDFVVGVARAGSCAAIVSGDKGLQGIGNRPVVTPRIFLDALSDEVWPRQPPSHGQ